MVSVKVSFVCIEELSRSLIAGYWREFKAGSTWNYYHWRPKYIDGDNWTSKNKWLSLSKECIEENTNILQALEVLLDLEFDNYISLAEKVIGEWYDSGAHDAYYYYDLISYLPIDHEVRKEFLSIDSFHDIYGEDSDLSIARSSLSRVRDENFIQSSSEYINRLLKQPTLEIDVIENRIVPILLDLDECCNMCVSEGGMERFKSICLEFFEKDKKIIGQIMNGYNYDGDIRKTWVGDNLAYLSWVLGWDDVLSMLDVEDLYWVAMFSEFWDDYENNNLLVWSLYRNDQFLRNRAIYVMEKRDLNRLDGAIAWSRLNQRKIRVT